MRIDATMLFFVQISNVIEKCNHFNTPLNLLTRFKELDKELWKVISL